MYIDTYYPWETDTYIALSLLFIIIIRIITLYLLYV